MATASTRTQESVEMASTSSKEESSFPVDSPYMESAETPELKSASSHTNKSSAPVKLPSGSSKEDSEEIVTTEMSSLASSKVESSAPVESPAGASEDGEEIDITEMPSTASSKGESSTSVESPPGTSKDSDKIDILSSKTASPLPASPPISTGASIKSPEATGSKCSCLYCCDHLFDVCCQIFMNWCESRQWKNIAIFGVGFVGLIVGLMLQENEVKFSLEVLYASILLMYCGLFACCFNRGCCFKTPSTVHPKRRKISSPAEVSEGEKSIKGAVPVAIKTDPSEHEMDVVIDVYRDPQGDFCM